jgi:hypothetical protein
MSPRLLVLFLAVANVWSCGKEEKCQPCTLSGVYTGVFHDVAGCYGCVPFRDTMFSGSFVVESTTHDSVRITRSHDKYEWKFAFSELGKYSVAGNIPLIEEFTFKSGDSLSYFYNRGGSGGYFRTTFEGKR